MKKLFLEDIRQILIQSSHSSSDSECRNKYIAHTPFNKDRVFDFIFDLLLQAPTAWPYLPYFKSPSAYVLHSSTIISLVFTLGL